jgi:copper chaperone
MKSKPLNAILILLVVAMLAMLALFVRCGTPANSVALLSISGMTCDNCVSAVDRTLKAKSGVSEVGVDMPGGIVTVGYDSGKVTADALATAVTGAGYRCRIAEVLTSGQFKARTGRDITASSKEHGCSAGCCGRNLPSKNPLRP